MSIDLDSAAAVVRRAIGSMGSCGITETGAYAPYRWKIGRRVVAELKNASTLMLYCPVDKKNELIAGDPATFFETEAYRGRPFLLARLSQISGDALRSELQRAWRLQAPKRLVAATDTRQAKPSTRVS
jgi:hypothetical protein